MQRLLPGCVAVFTALHGIAFAVLCTQTAVSAETAWDPMSSRPGSTLGAQIAPQDFDLPAAVFVMIGQEAKPESLQLRPAQSSNPKLASPRLARAKTPTKKTPTPIAETPKTQTPKTATSKTSPSLSLREQRSKPVTSPFTKWVSPKASSTAQNDTKPTTAPPIAPAPAPTVSPDDAFSDAKPIPAPQVARRILPQKSPARNTTGRRGSQSTTSRNKTQAETKSRSTKSTSQRSRSQTTSLPVVSFPTPVAELTTPTPKINAADLPPLTQSQQRLRTKIKRVLSHYSQRPLNTRDRSPWEMMHALLSYEVDSQFLRGGPKGEPVSAIGWLCFNQACKRRTLMYVNDSGKMRVRVGPALQGHRGQFLAMLAQAKVSKNYPMRIEGHDFTVSDLAKMEMETCYPRTELTFKLIGLMHYLDSDATWMNDQGMQWNIPRLISEELKQPVRGAACGGTHRLSGLTLAYKTRLLRGEPIDGQYLKAKQFVSRYQQYAYRLQNRDGSFSTEWFRGSGNENSIDRKLKTTGHLLEWLLYAASENQLRHQKTANAANYLATTMYNNRYKDWEAGPLGHAIHALLLYDRMVFSHYGEPKNLPIAKKSRRSTTKRSKR